MATTTDMAPNRSAAPAAPSRRSSRSGGTSSRSAARNSRDNEDELSAQVAQLQSDLKAIAVTLSGLAESKVQEAQGMAKREASHLAHAGQNVIEDVQDEFGQLEKQIKDTIREKPLTAVAGAIALGFVLAVVSR